MRYSDITLGKVEAIINKLGGGEGVNRFLAGDWEVAIKRHVINTNLEPYRDDEFFGIAKNKALLKDNGLLKWDPEKILLYKTPSHSKRLSLSEQLKSISTKPLLNACVRDYLLKHTELLPQEWTSSILCFGGTIFRDRNNNMFLPTILCRGRKWKDVYFGLDDILTCQPGELAFLMLKD